MSKDGGIAFDSGNYRKIGNILQSYDSVELSDSDKLELKKFTQKAIEINIADVDKDTWNLQMFELDQEVSKFINEKNIRLYRK